MIACRDGIMQPRIKLGPGDVQYPIVSYDSPYSVVIIEKVVFQSGSLAKYRAPYP